MSCLGYMGYMRGDGRLQGSYPIAGCGLLDPPPQVTHATLNSLSRWIARGTSIIKRKQTFSKASPSAVALLPPSPRLRRTRWRDKFRLRQGSGATSPPSLRFRLRRGFRFLGPPEPPGGRGGLNFGFLASPCSPRNLFNHHEGQTQSAPTRMVRVYSREFAFIRVYKNKNMRKREPSKLDPFADKLDQWLGVEKMNRRQRILTVPISAWSACSAEENAFSFCAFVVHPFGFRASPRPPSFNSFSGFNPCNPSSVQVVGLQGAQVYSRENKYIQ